MARVSASVEAAREAALRFFEEEGDNERDRLVMARALGSLFVAGALVGLISLALPHAASTKTTGIGALCAAALLVGAAIVFEQGRMPRWAFPAACYVATILIALALYFSDRANSAYSFYFVLVAMFTAYFLSVRQ